MRERELGAERATQYIQLWYNMYRTKQCMMQRDGRTDGRREGGAATELLLLAVRESFYRSANRRRSKALKQRGSLAALLLL